MSTTAVDRHWLVFKPLTAKSNKRVGAYPHTHTPRHAKRARTERTHTHTCTQARARARARTHTYIPLCQAVVNLFEKLTDAVVDGDKFIDKIKTEQNKRENNKNFFFFFFLFFFFSFQNHTIQNKVELSAVRIFQANKLTNKTVTMMMVDMKRKKKKLLFNFL